MRKLLYLRYASVEIDPKKLPKAILSMAELGAQRVLVEGGAELLTQLINKKLVDILYWFRASKLIGKDLFFKVLAGRNIPLCARKQP